MLINHDNICGLKIPSMRNLLHTLTLDGDKKNTGQENE